MGKNLFNEFLFHTPPHILYKNLFLGPAGKSNPYGALLKRKTLGMLNEDSNVCNFV